MTSRSELSDSSYVFSAAIALAIMAIATNIVACLAFGPTSLPLGNIFLFICAAAFGPLPGALCVTAGVLPDAMVTGEVFGTLRLMVLVGAVGAWRKYNHTTPMHLIAVVTWILFIAPCLMLISQAGLTTTVWSGELLIKWALFECVACLVADSLLLNGWLWTKLTRSPRVTPLKTSISYAITTIGVGSLLIAAFCSFGSDIGFRAWYALFVAYLVLSTFPFYVSDSVVTWIHTHVDSLRSGELIATGRGPCFSGLASDYWRRVRQESEFAIPSSASNQNNAEQAATSEDSDGICAIDSTGTIGFSNSAFLRILNIASTNLAGQHIEKIGLDRALVHDILQLVEETLATGQTRTIECKVNQLPQSLRYYQITAQPPSLETQTPMSMITTRSPEGSNQDRKSTDNAAVLIVKEITDRRTVESQLLKAQKVESLGQMVKGIGHEFNNALLAISGEASIAKHSADTKQELLASLSRILATAERAGQAVHQLLEFAEDKPPALNLIDLTSELPHEIDLLRKVAGEHVELVFSAPSEAAWVECDHNLLTQALVNLVKNSRDSYSGCGEVQIVLDTETVDSTVSALHLGARPGEYVRIRVSDRGVGMNRETLAKAFDPLFTTKATPSATGLGLSMVFTTVRAHNGFLTAESHPGRGTSVSIYLPRASADTVRLGETHKASKQRTQRWNEEWFGTNENILVVEDEKAIRDLLGEMLRSLRYQVTCCENGEEALEIAAHDEFDLVLVDFAMPKMSGEEVISELKATSPDVRTLLMTGYGCHAPAEKTGTNMLYKPFGMETLAAAVRTTLTQEESRAAPVEFRVEL